MKTKFFLTSILFLIILSSCTNNVNYSQEHIKKTSGRYLYSPEEVIDVYYDDNKLYLKWKGASKIEPVVLDEHTFFVPDMYKKLRFVEQLKTNKQFLGVVSENDETVVTYEYLKVDDDYKTPRMHLNDKEYDKALAGYLEIQKQDSTSVLVNESEFNRLGYNLLQNKEHENAIAVFKMNVALYPDSDNVYDSLADAYLKSGDSLQAFNNYKKVLELNTGNKRAKKFVEAYEKK